MVRTGRGKGRRLGTVAYRLARGKVRSSRTRVRLRRGRYEIALCATSPTTRCARRRVTVRRGRVKLPRLAVVLGAEGRVSYTVTAVGRRFAARTASRGVLLRG